MGWGGSVASGVSVEIDVRSSCRILLCQGPGGAEQGDSAVGWDTASEWGQILHVNWDSERDRDVEDTASLGRGKEAL